MIHAKYSYVRVTVSEGSVEVCAGLALLPGEQCDELYDALRKALGPVMTFMIERDDLDLAEAYERLVLARWPGRSYFVEVGRGGDAYVQVFQPDDGDWLSGTAPRLTERSH